MWKPLLAFVAVAGIGAVLIGVTLAMLVPAGRELAFGTTSYGSALPEFAALAERSVVVDRNGEAIAVLFAEEDRAPIPLELVPEHVVDAVIAIEDQNYYEHNGIDVKATVRALVRNVEAGEVVQGGSTITQQLVDIALFEKPERSLERRIREAVLASRLEEELDKDQILERYLNEVYFGSGAYGVRAASERFFDKQPADLTVGEAALLAGLIQRPEGLNPINFPERSRERRSQVLDAMEDQGYATAAEVQAAKREPLPTDVKAFSESRPAPNNFFVEEVKRRLLRDERLGETYQERYEKLFRGGLTIHTTFDPRLQFIAASAVAGTVPESNFTAALVAVDNDNGDVLALYGGDSFDEEQFNLATQSIRQTGSSFKPITLATALANGYSPDDRVDGSGPCRFEVPGSEDWEINSRSSGVMTLRNATVNSVNCAYARLAFSVTPEKIVAMADNLGIDTAAMLPVPSITLGTQGTPVVDMAAAYSVFAADGVYHEPRFVTSVEGPNGEVLFSTAAPGQQVLDTNVARTMTDVLSGVIASGTGTRAQLDGGRAAFGKTGTTDDLVDALFVGGTRQITTAVWMGNPEELEPMVNVGQFSSVFGGTYPALIWKTFMEPAHLGLPFEEFSEPDPTLWPSSASVIADGRQIRSISSYRPPSVTVPTTVPTDTVPTDDTVPPGDTTPESTAPPDTSPADTAPPATAAPQTVPADPQAEAEPAG